VARSASTTFDNYRMFNLEKLIYTSV